MITISLCMIVKDEENVLGRCLESIKDSVTIKEQAYNSALSVLKLSKTYSNERLENACEMALPMICIPRYKHLKGILASDQDMLYAEQKQSSTDSKSEQETEGFESTYV